MSEMTCLESVRKQLAALFQSDVESREAGFVLAELILGRLQCSQLSMAEHCDHISPQCWPQGSAARCLLTRHSQGLFYTEATDLGVRDLESQSCQLILRASLERDEVHGRGRGSPVQTAVLCQSRVPVKGPVAEHKTQGRG